MTHRNRTRWILAWLFVGSAAGCGSSEESVPPQPVATLEATEKVNLLEIDGELAHVRTADGKEFYIRQDRLQDRSTLDRSDEDYTHVLSAAADAYEEPPAELPIPEPRPTKEVALEGISLNQLYLTEKTLTEVIAPARFMAPWDEELGERCFPALTCENPDCPGEPRGDRPYLFIVPFSPGAAGGEHMCPACAEAHPPATRTPAERSQYRKWVKPYRLPEQAARLEQLDAEMRASARARRSR